MADSEMMSTGILVIFGCHLSEIVHQELEGISAHSEA